ncbi:CD225/dispanin family protein [Nocardia sp. NPDC052566]|uniref:CD225/dispanin family protein n=1 Tax=Nocardia sp. NPDC052566 TaxID=3364330 RepID=UPI0037CA1FFA
MTSGDSPDWLAKSGDARAAGPQDQPNGVPAYGNPHGYQDQPSGGQPLQNPYGYPYSPYPPQGYGYVPYAPYGPPLDPAAMPPKYLAWSIIVTVIGAIGCTFGLAFGIVAIVYGNQVSSKWQMGDAYGAEAASKKAKMWAIAATVCDGLIAVFVVVMLIVSAINPSAFD